MGFKRDLYKNRDSLGNGEIVMDLDKIPVVMSFGTQTSVGIKYGVPGIPSMVSPEFLTFFLISFI